MRWLAVYGLVAAFQFLLVMLIGAMGGAEEWERDDHPWPAPVRYTLFAVVCAVTWPVLMGISAWAMIEKARGRS